MKRTDILRILDTYSNDDKATKKLITDAIFDLANDIFSFAESEEEYDGKKVKNCNKADAVGRSEQFTCDHQWYIRFSEKRGSWRLCAKCSKEV